MFHFLYVSGLAKCGGRCTATGVQLSAAERGEVTRLSGEMSTAFDAVDHEMRIDGLHHCFGIRDKFCRRLEVLSLAYESQWRRSVVKKLAAVAYKTRQSGILEYLHCDIRDYQPCRTLRSTTATCHHSISI